MYRYFVMTKTDKVKNMKTSLAFVFQTKSSNPDSLPKTSLIRRNKTSQIRSFFCQNKAPKSEIYLPKQTPSPESGVSCPRTIPTPRRFSSTSTPSKRQNKNNHTTTTNNNNNNNKQNNNNQYRGFSNKLQNQG